MEKYFVKSVGTLIQLHTCTLMPHLVCVWKVGGSCILSRKHLTAQGSDSIEYQEKIHFGILGMEILCSVHIPIFCINVQAPPLGIHCIYQIK